MFNDKKISELQAEINKLKMAGYTYKTGRRLTKNMVIGGCLITDVDYDEEKTLPMKDVIDAILQHLSLEIKETDKQADFELVKAK